MKIQKELLELLSNAQHVVVSTGAGVSAESGIKTFRDPDGLWTKLKPQELASIEGFMANPELVWSWYRQRIDIISKTVPNPGHFALAEMEDLFPSFTLITQNVDRLHHKAGSTIVHELHGNIVENHCQQCKRKYEDDVYDSLLDNRLPICPECGGFVRPSVVWFGETLPQKAFTIAEYASRDCDIFFSIGTSGEVQPAANLPIIAKQNGAVLVEVNPNETLLSSYADFRFEGVSGKVLPDLLEYFKKYVRENK